MCVYLECSINSLSRKRNVSQHSASYCISSRSRSLTILKKLTLCKADKLITNCEQLNFTPFVKRGFDFCPDKNGGFLYNNRFPIYTIIMLRYNSDNLNFARANRKQRNSTRQEGILWHCYLKSCPINFSRQYRVDNYILDFYAPSIKLAIELDGSQHFEDRGEAYDIVRTERLNNVGVTVLRFTNLDVDIHLADVVRQIENKIRDLKV